MKKQFVSSGTARFQADAMADGCVRHVGNDEYEVTAYVDAQNAFGCTVRRAFRCRVHRLEKGRRWRLAGNVEWR